MYICILRGINVAGKKKIKMADLIELFQMLGHKNVSTYIQSGNVFFEPKSQKPRNILKDEIEKAILKTYSFHVEVDIRTHEELERILLNFPFDEAKSEDNYTKLLVTFLQSAPSKENKEILLKYVQTPDKLLIIDKEVYLYCPNGYGKSKLNNTFIEKKLALFATTRNYKSVKKLYELSKN